MQEYTLFVALLLITFQASSVLCSDPSPINPLKEVELFYSIALEEPLNLSKLFNITEELFVLGQNTKQKLLQRKSFSVTDMVDPSTASSIFQQQQIPLLHYFLNVYLLHQQSPTDRAVVMSILYKCIELGMDITLPFKDDPPIYHKSLMIKEFLLTKHILQQNSKVFLTEIIARNNKLHKFLKLLYSYTSEVIPMTKLLLHIQKVVDYIFQEFQQREQENASSNSGPENRIFNGSTILLQLLRSARLDKPTTKPLELMQLSPTYNEIIKSISQPELAEKRLSNILSLNDLLQSLNELVFSIFQDLVGHIEQSDRREVAIQHFFDIHITPDEQQRTLFHYLAIGNSVQIVNCFVRLWEEKSKRYQHSIEAGVGVDQATASEFGELRERLHAGLNIKDLRGHTPLSYSIVRFGVESQIYKALVQLLSSVEPEQLTLEADLNDSNQVVEMGDISEDASFSSLSEIEEGKLDGGGWDSSRIVFDEADFSFQQSLEVCDILEVWNKPLPSAEEFFLKYINSATPVIFRNSALLSTEKMNKLRTIFAKEVFLKKNGKLKVSASTIPYGESFGVKSTTSTLKQIANHKDQGLDSNSSISLSQFLARHRENKSITEAPNYVFITPPYEWGSRFSEEIPIPAPLIIRDGQGLSNSCSESKIPPINLTAVATNTQRHGSVLSYSFELQFYLGSRGTGAPVHYHGHAINTLAYGEKKWIIYPVNRALYSTLSGMEFHALIKSNLTDVWSSEKKSQFKELTQNYLQCTQQAGDILYVPPLFGHSTFNTKQSIGVAHEFSVESFCME